ncbi:uncharacterized protein LOC121862526 [Homarus americanus]|uniref:uncharacterized protein LOC121862526 n=1 Tax=Homarus americanus TaxID=6706 RepID=UPI001C48E545|nr:uncharacterized protein LOC121862526 [Homarus americanus]
MARLVHLLSLLPLLNCCLVLTSADQCLIRTHQEIEAPFSVNVLNYINPWNGTEIAIAYDNRDDVYWRDSFFVYNFQTKQYTTRDGKSEEQHFPHVIVVPHGWITMNLTVFGNQFNLTLNDTQPVTIISSDLIFEIASVTLYGKFSICQSLSPTWKVGEGKSVEVPLQPQYTWGSSQRQQTLLVTGPTNARPYLTSPSHPDDKTYIPPNINFLVKISYQESSVFMYPYQQAQTERKPGSSTKEDREEL